MGAADKIREGFRALLQTTPYDKITINHILKISDVSRKTFYKYFEGKPDLVAALYVKDVIEPIRAIRDNLTLEEIKSAPLLLTERGYQTLYDNRDIYTNLVKNFGETEMVRLMITHTCELNKSIYENYDFLGDDLDFVSYILATTKPMIFLYWMNEGFQKSPKKMAKLHNDWTMARWREIGFTLSSRVTGDG